MDFFRAGNILAWFAVIYGAMSVLHFPLQIAFPETYPIFEDDPLYAIRTGIQLLFTGVAMGILVRIGRAVTGARQTHAIEQQPNPWMRENPLKVPPSGTGVQ